MISCADGSIYDVLLERCNWEYASFCVVKSCAPTPNPTSSPTSIPSNLPSTLPSTSPTDLPSSMPTASPSSVPSGNPSNSPTAAPSFLYDFFSPLETDSMRQSIESTVLQSYNPAGIASPSTKYLYEGLIKSLKEMAKGISSDGRSFKFYVAYPEGRLDYGMTSVAAFLANAMTESIVYDTCDEFNVDMVTDRYPLSNSCGQNNRSYQDEVCTNSEEVDMSCPVDVNMEVVSSGYSTGMMGRAPPPFSCGPKAHSADYSGYWESKTGTSSKTAYSNARGRTDTEGCCFWGRGALLTRGVCKECPLLICLHYF